MAGVIWSDWVEWKEQCALGRCSTDTRQRLAAFAAARLRVAASHCAGTTNIRDGIDRRLPDDPELAWHLLESHAVVKHTREGKAYKEWLFARVGPDTRSPLAVVCRGAALILRDVARNWLAKECLRHHHLSLDAPVAGTHEALTYVDLLPGTASPADAVSARELSDWSKREARAVMESLNVPQRLVVAAKLRGISLSNPELMAATGWRSTKACSESNRIFASLRPRLHQICPDEPESAQRALAALLIQELEKIINMWISAACAVPALFQ